MISIHTAFVEIKYPLILAKAFGGLVDSLVNG